jgi:hypothetical protein
MVLLHGNLDIVAYEARTTRVSRRKHNVGRIIPDCVCRYASLPFRLNGEPGQGPDYLCAENAVHDQHE